MMPTHYKRIALASLLTTFVIYTAMVYTARPNVEQGIPVTERIRQGHQLFQEKNCIACHQLYGLGGYMGPDLTNVISRNGPEYASAFLAGGTQRMPDFELSEKEIDALVGFLEFVDASGRFPDDYEVYWHGAVEETDD